MLSQSTAPDNRLGPASVRPRSGAVLPCASGDSGNHPERHILVRQDIDRSVLANVDYQALAASRHRRPDQSRSRQRETGQVKVGPGWRSLEASWYLGIATIASSGTGVIVDEVFLDGGAGQERLRTALSGLEVLWVGVTCDHDVARTREALRPDRVAGQADSQANVVHEGVEYNLIVDTSHATSESCAAQILERVSTSARVRGAPPSQRYERPSIPIVTGFAEWPIDET